MKILTRQQQDTLLDFIAEQYLVALRSHKNGVQHQEWWLACYEYEWVLERTRNIF